METTKQEQPVTDQDKFVRGLYRNIGELARAVTHLANSITVAFPPKMDFDQIREVAVQENLPGIGQDDTSGLPSGLRWVNEPGVAYKPGDIAKEIAKKPRTWCNTVKVWEWLADKYTVFSLCDMARDVGEISRITNGRISAASYSRIVSTLKRAGAIYKTTRNTYMPLKPTDELREAVERVAKKRKEVAA